VHQTGLCAIVIPPCHFDAPDRLCRTTIMRLRAGLDFMRAHRPWRFFFVLTGDVSYRPGGVTLAELMGDYLRGHGYSGETVIAHGMTGSFWEPRLVCKTLMRRKCAEPELRLKHLVVISSDWQLRLGDQFWREATAGTDLQYHPEAIHGTGGWRTRLSYGVFTLVVSAARTVGLWPRLERYLWKRVYRPRYTRGFQANGCA